MTTESVALLLGAYAFGAIPFGFLLARMQGVDITAHGSGNIGATNVMRVFGWKLGIVVLLLDMLKGIVFPVLARALGLGQDWALAVGLAAVVGHCFSPFLGFKGGKGIATILGASLGAQPAIAAAGLAVFSVGFALSRIVSISCILGLLAAVIYAQWSNAGPLVVAVYAALWVFVLLRHRQNLVRLLNGEEPRLSLRGKKLDETQAGPLERLDLGAPDMEVKR